jgi:hypothetical protein
MKRKEIVGSLKKVQASVRLPGADEPKNAFQVFKQQFENFSEYLFHAPSLLGGAMTNLSLSLF